MVYVDDARFEQLRSEECLWLDGKARAGRGVHIESETHWRSAPTRRCDGAGARGAVLWAAVAALRGAGGTARAPQLQRALRLAPPSLSRANSRRRHVAGCCCLSGGSIARAAAARITARGSGCTRSPTVPARCFRRAATRWSALTSRRRALPRRRCASPAASSVHGHCCGRHAGRVPLALLPSCPGEAHGGDHWTQALESLDSLQAAWTAALHDRRPGRSCARSPSDAVARPAGVGAAERHPTVGLPGSAGWRWREERRRLAQRCAPAHRASSLFRAF